MVKSLFFTSRPKTLTRTRHMHDGKVLYVAGRNPSEAEQCDIMFVTVSVDEDEASTHSQSAFGFKISQPAEYLKGPSGMIKDIALRCGIDMDKHYYTAVCKWLLPRMKRLKPAVKTLRWGLPMLMDEIARLKPKIIVCLGKQPFDLLCDQKINFKDAHGGWFYSTEAQAHLYLMNGPAALIGRPELYESFRVDFNEVHRKHQVLLGHDVQELPIRYEIINDEQSLRDWVSRMIEERNFLWCVDGEWHNAKTHVDANLRMMQWAWTESDAVVTEFRNEKNEFCFQFDDPMLENHLEVAEWIQYNQECEKVFRLEVEYGTLEAAPAGSTSTTVIMTDPPAARAEVARIAKLPGSPDWLRKHNAEALARAMADLPPEPTPEEIARRVERAKYAYIGDILKPLFHQPEIRYIGHHIAADFPMMIYWLGLDIWSRCVMDTEFAQQTLDESSELGLERGIAMKYTTLGYYSLDLILWKRDHKKLCEDGYGFIPREIIMPYGVKDVLTPFRAYPMIRKQLEYQGLSDYHDRLLLPFVTDVFTEFAMNGLPMDIPMMDEVRKLFHFAERELDRTFRDNMTQRAKSLLLNALFNELGAVKAFDVAAKINGKPYEEAMSILKAHTDPAKAAYWIKMMDHLHECPNFKSTSPDQMRRWLFDVEGLVPIKSTNQKAKGLPSMSWENVLELPPDRQKLFTPAVDKQTLQILGEQCPLIDELLDLKVVATVGRSFLKEPTVYFDEELGEEVIDENGLHSWLASDGRIHCQYSLLPELHYCIPDNGGV